MEDDQRREINQELQQFCRTFFQDANEVALVRPLCVLLGYLINDAAYDMLRGPVDFAVAQRLEGNVGDLELLHPCIEDPTLTRYQALFCPRAEFDRYRYLFFLNSAHNSTEGHREWMLGALHVLAEELGHSALLRRAEELVTSRYHCYGAFEFPPSCNREIAW